MTKIVFLNFCLQFSRVNSNSPLNYSGKTTSKVWFSTGHSTWIGGEIKKYAQITKFHLVRSEIEQQVSKNRKNLMYIKLTVWVNTFTYLNAMIEKFMLFLKSPRLSRFWNRKYFPWKMKNFVKKNLAKKFSLLNCSNFQVNQLTTAFDDIDYCSVSKSMQLD